MSDTKYDGDRPPLADRIRQAPTLEDAIREVLDELDDENLTSADGSEGTSDTQSGPRGR